MNKPQSSAAERERMATPGPWRKFGPYLGDRQWGTVREDYSPDGSAWEYFPHDHARSRAYRWGEDGIAGFSDDQQLLCLALSLWNSHDPILKERLFGLTGPEGNHGEDVKELYYFLDATPSHSYLKALYKYPHASFPYEDLVRTNAERSKKEPEYEVLDTGVFDDQRYFDVFIEYAKAGPEDFTLRIEAINRGPEPAELVLAPQIWFRNTWSWGEDTHRPQLSLASAHDLLARHETLGVFRVECDRPDEIIFCENETNTARLYADEDANGPFKDGVNDYLVHGLRSAISQSQTGTKAAAIWRRVLGPGESFVTHLRVCRPSNPAGIKSHPTLFEQRIEEANTFYDALAGPDMSEEARLVQRQAFAGMIWSKLHYCYDIRQWLAGDPTQIAPPEKRKSGRNSSWTHLNNSEIISMPDKWEYPWYAAWDLAFHCVPLAQVDPEFAKGQLVLLTREWYMHPNGQLPAYEWAFGDVNPPVHAWATWRVFEIDRAQRGDQGDLDFLERVLHKLLINFTWWVNRKDAHGLNVFQGGFLGLDNIGVFDRSADLPVNGHLDQADGTAWMAMYAVNLMRISLELALHRPAYEDIASKFFEHFLYIAQAMSNVGGHGVELWSEEDGFFYDVIHYDNDASHVCESMPLRIRSLVGLIPLFAVDVLGPEMLEEVTDFKARMAWFLENRPELARLISRWNEPGEGSTSLLSLLRGHRMKLLLKRMLDENEFLSDFGVRSLSKHHESNPYELKIGTVRSTVSYRPGESDSTLFGGNSNWRGPIWMPTNYLLIESLRKFHSYYGDEFRVECPTGSGNLLSLQEVAEFLSTRLVQLFLPNAEGVRPGMSQHPIERSDPHFKNLCQFYEHFHGDSGRGIGASHQTGWTGLIATILTESGGSH